MKKRIMCTRTLAIVFATLILVTFLPFIAMNQVHAQVTSASRISGVMYHTKEEVQAYLAANSANLNDPVAYTIAPVTTAPYSQAGALSAETNTQALNIINQIRYIAGLDANVTNNADFETKAQAACYVNYAIGVAGGSLTHNPSPTYSATSLNMDTTIFNLGNTGSGESNLSRGYTPLNTAIIQGWMYDGDASNIAALGHRRWILNPTMSQTGFGTVESYTAMYCFDMSNTAAAQTGVAWPAQTMPVEYFGADYPWSISMGEAVASASVTLTRRSDGTVWTFSDTDASGGDFYINNDAYGQPGAIIWRPIGVTAYNEGDIFDVAVTASGTAGTVLNQSYSVEFISATATGGTNKVTPTYTIPTGLTATVGQTLADITLPAADNGTFTWAADPATSLGNVGEQTFYVSFTPNDTTVYETVTHIPVIVTVTDAGGTDVGTMTYVYLEGANGTVVSGQTNGYTVKANGEFTKFTDVAIDGVIVDPVNYTASSGSTIITFHADYLNTLSIGEHILAVNYTDGSVTTTLTIQAATPIPNNTPNTATTTIQNRTAGMNSPQTGDATSFIWLFVLISVSGVGIVVLAKRLKVIK